MVDIQDLAVIDASNTGRWPENMVFSAVNDAGRADEGLLARWYKDLDSSVTASGSPNAYAVTSNRTISALVNNTVMCFTANFTNTGAATLNLNGLGAKTIKRFNGDGLANGDITSGQPVTVIYKSSPDVWFMMTAAASLAFGGTLFDFSEVGAVSAPGADVARAFAIDDGSGKTLFAIVDSASYVSYLRTATQAEMEAVTANRIPAVATQHFHPGHPKAWATVNQVGGGPAVLNGSYGLSSITDAGTGLTTHTMSTAMSGADTYGVVGTCRAQPSGSSARTWVAQSGGSPQTTTTYRLVCAHNDSNAVDADYLGSIVCGDQT